MPFVLVRWIVSLNGIDVLAGAVRDSTKHVYWLVAESTWAVVMASNIQVWHFEPEVDVWVVHFALGLGGVLLLSWACDDNELFAEPAGWVAMPWVFHWVALYELEMVIDLYFVKSIECLIVTLVVASTNQEKLLGIRILHALKIMWKTTIIVRLNFNGLNCFTPDVDLVNVLRVLL